MPGLDDPVDLAWAAGIFRQVWQENEASRSQADSEKDGRESSEEESCPA